MYVYINGTQVGPYVQSLEEAEDIINSHASAWTPWEIKKSGQVIYSGRGKI